MIRVINKKTNEISYVSEKEWLYKKKKGQTLINKYKLCKKREKINELAKIPEEQKY